MRLFTVLLVPISPLAPEPESWFHLPVICVTAVDISKYISVNLEKVVAGEREKAHDNVLLQGKPTRAGSSLQGSNSPVQAALAYPGSEGGRIPGDASKRKENRGPRDREDGMVPDTFLGH